MATPLASLTPREHQVLKIVGDYLNERGQRCFSYEGIYAYYERCCKDQLPATTLDRTIRKLVEKGVLERREVKPSANKPTSKRRTVIFCWTDSAERAYRELRRLDEEQERRMLEEKLRELLGSDTILRYAPRPDHELEFFATGAPDWWPYQLMTLSSKTTPKRGYIILLDNNAFRYWRKGEWPDFNKWLYELKTTAMKLANTADEVRVILPDKPHDPRTSFDWYLKSYNMLCSESVKKHGVKCVATAHYDPSNPLVTLKSMVDHILDALPDVDIIASPTKPYCGRYKTDKIVVSDVCFIGTVGRIANLVGGKKPIHVLAPPLRTNVLARIAPLVHSFDTTSWTRPISSELRKLGIKHSAKSQQERELMFAFTVAYLNKSGVPIKRSELAFERLPVELSKALGV